MRLRLAALIACLTLGLSGVHARQIQLSALTSSPLEGYLESLRAQTGIPGMSAALVQDGEIVWERGFGFQNLESRIRATPDTPYPIADISQTIAAVLVLQCAEQRRLGIDDPVRRYGGVISDQSATLRQVLNHTSAGTGESFHYDPERYSQLTPVVEACVPQPYRKSVAVNVLERLAMKDSVPGRDSSIPMSSPSHCLRPRFSSATTVYSSGSPFRTRSTNAGAPPGTSWQPKGSTPRPVS